MRLLWILLLLPALLLSGCATVHGPTSFTLSAGEVEQAIVSDLGALVELFRGLDTRRPEVAFMPMAGRMELVWNIALPGEPAAGAPFGGAYGVAVVVTGRPQLNAARNAIDLADVKLDDVRVLGLPRLLGFGLARLAERKGSALPDLPIMALAPERLRHGDIAYEATGLTVTWRGLQVDMAPR